MDERRLIDANAFIAKYCESCGGGCNLDDCCCVTVDDLMKAPTIDAEPVVHGRWVKTANKEHANERWNVTAECSECHSEKKEIYAGFFPDVPDNIAKITISLCADSVKLSNYCPHCGAKMDGE